MNDSVSVLIPSVAGDNRLIELARALAAGSGRPVEVIVADNGLAPEVAAGLLEAGARVVAMGANLGFGVAVNRAARVAEGDLLVITNDDVEPEPGFVEEIVAPLERGADVAAGVLLMRERPGFIETAGLVIDSVLMAYDHLHGEPAERLHGAVESPLGPCGAAAALPRAAFRAAGGFDESIFAYGEDLDLALRLHALGAACALAPGARAYHAGSATAGYASLRKAELVGFSRGYLLRKYGVLRRPASLVRAGGLELAMSLVLGRRHRSARPALARARGWRACHTRASRPPAALATVSFGEGLKRRRERIGRAAGPGFASGQPPAAAPPDAAL